MSAEQQTVVINREKLTPSPVRSYRVNWKWTYTYRVDQGPVAQYGPGLTDLLAMLKRKFPGARIVKNWEATK